MYNGKTPVVYAGTKLETLLWQCVWIIIMLKNEPAANETLSIWHFDVFISPSILAVFPKLLVECSPKP